MNVQVPFLPVNILAFCCFSIMLVMFLAAKKTPEIRIFIFVLADSVIWSAGSILMRLQMWPGIPFWYYISLVALFSMELLFYWFVYTFYHRRGKLILFSCIIGTAAILPGTVTGFYLAPPQPIVEANGDVVFRYTTNWHIIIPCILFIYIIGFTVRMFRYLLKEQGMHSPGLKVIIYSGLVMLAGNLMQILIPGNIFPYDATAGVIFAVLLMYALYKKRMFQMTMIVSYGIILVLTIGICLLTATLLILPMKHFLQGKIGLSDDTSLIVVSVVFAFLLIVITTILRQSIEAVFLRKDIRGKIINRFSNEVSQTLNSTEIMEKLSQVIIDELPVKRVYVCLREKNYFRSRYCSDSLANLSFDLSVKSALCEYLGGQADYIVLSEFRNSPLYLSLWEADKRMLQAYDVGCIAAMKEGKNILGLILLTAPDHGKNYRSGDISFLETVGSISSIAIKNAGLYEEMFREARIDPLTGAFNYRYFMELNSLQFKKFGREALSLILIDIDDFKLYNQLYGVAAGDEALRNISREITLASGDGNLVFRTSGKVFAVLMPRQDSRKAWLLADEIEHRIQHINNVPERCNVKQLTASIGICSAPYAASSAKELLDNADLASYNAKQNGKNHIAIFRSVSDVPNNLKERMEAAVGRIGKEGDGYYNSMPAISALTAAIDAKDHYTYNHSRNVARYAAYLAVAAGLNDEQVRTIYEAGLLHDIGKISIPEYILNKTGKLTDEEYRIMKEHVNNSIEIIRHLPEMDYLIPAAIGHHERWDGTGYPRGIRAEEIPVTARCLSIADVFDAITTDRPYRKGMATDYALEQIQHGAGKQFDPHLTEIFIQMIHNHQLPASG